MNTFPRNFTIIFMFIIMTLTSWFDTHLSASIPEPWQRLQNNGSGKRKKGGTIAWIKKHEIKPGEKIQVKVLSGNFQYITIHTRKQGGIWRTLYKGPQKEFAYSRYFQRAIKNKRVTHFIFQVNGANERFLRVKCRVALYKIGNINNKDLKKSVIPDTNASTKIPGKIKPGSGSFLGTVWTDGTGHHRKEGKGGIYIKIPKNRFNLNDVIVFEAEKGYMKKIGIGAIYKKKNRISMISRNNFPKKKSHELVLKNGPLASKLKSRYYGDFVFIVNGDINWKGKDTYLPLKSKVNIRIRKVKTFPIVSGYKGNIKITEMKYDYYGIKTKWLFKNKEKYRNQACSMYIIFSKNNLKNSKDILKQHWYYNGGKKTGGISSEIYRIGKLSKKSTYQDYLANNLIIKKYGKGKFYFQVIVKDNANNIVEISNLKHFNLNKLRK